MLADEDVAHATGRPHVRIKRHGFFHEGAHRINEVSSDMIELVAAQTAGRAALAEADDIDLVAIYAPCTIVGMPVSKAPDFTVRGRGAGVTRDAETTLGRRIPIGTPGGVQSRGHPAYVTPFYSFVESIDQLRRRANERRVGELQCGHR